MKIFKRHKFKIIALVLFLVFMLSLLGEAKAQNCAPEHAMISALTIRYGEQVVSTKTHESNSELVLFEVWANETTGTWTFTGRHDGMMCAINSGHEYAGQDVDTFLEGMPLIGISA